MCALAFTRIIQGSFQRFAAFKTTSSYVEAVNVKHFLPIVGVKNLKTRNVQRTLILSDLWLPVSVGLEPQHDIDWDCFCLLSMRRCSYRRVIAKPFAWLCASWTILGFTVNKTEAL